MSRIFSLFVGLLCAFGLSGAHAASYQFTGPTYGTGITNYVPPCPAGSCADYSAGMRTTGWFSYLGSLPPNLANHNLHADPNLLSYGLSDGLARIESRHPATRMVRFQVSTDALGAITGYWMVLSKWADDLAGPHVANDRIHVIGVLSSGPSTNLHNWRCAAVGPTFPANVVDGCDTLGSDIGGSEAQHSNVGANWSGVPTLSISSVSATEGNAGVTNFNFTVSLDAAPSAPVNVGWWTAPPGTGTATPGVDYYVYSSALFWGAGDSTSRTVTVQVIGDTTFEPNETFRVELFGPQGLGLGNQFGTGTIENDDVAPAVSAVPTLSEWSLMLLIGLMAAGAIVRSRRKPRHPGF